MKIYNAEDIADVNGPGLDCAGLVLIAVLSGADYSKVFVKDHARSHNFS